MLSLICPLNKTFTFSSSARLYRSLVDGRLQLSSFLLTFIFVLSYCTMWKIRVDEYYLTLSNNKVCDIYIKLVNYCSNKPPIQICDPAQQKGVSVQRMFHISCFERHISETFHIFKVTYLKHCMF